MGKLKDVLTTIGFSAAYAAQRRAPQLAQRSESARGAKAPECPPSSKTGGTESAAACAVPTAMQLVMTDTGEVKAVMVRVPVDGQVAMIDTLRFTIGEETFKAEVGGVDDVAYIMVLSEKLTEILGYGVTRDLKRSRDFYLNAWELGDNYGHVAMGGQNQRATIMVGITGAGCLAARAGWERRLFDWLKTKARRATITRVDLAHDAFEGEVTVDQADKWFDDGLFTASVNAPHHEYKGNWKKPNGKGRSLYIGLRRNGKLCRIYEKGKEQGDALSEWVRVEVEYRNVKRVIPFDVLLDPSAFFVASYPCLRFIDPGRQPERMEIKRKTAQINVEASFDNILNSYGKYVPVLVGLVGPEEFLKRVTSKSGIWPQRLKVPDYELCERPMHERPRNPRFNDLDPSDDGWTGETVISPAGKGVSHAFYQ
ncbi:replication initiation factor domain-containing protein [Ralstonia pickettii]|uniref:replication initiation factor domain-containing protein n=1 Tax=Ralstonia pickettii TaxID=329 RepID=UPI0020A628DB|nr:replication initiation factor domain-containing protein [Ralstonia pickettii]